MAIQSNNSNLFAAFAPNKGAAAKADREDRPKAQLWLNVGYTITVQDEQGKDVDQFVSLPQGIPLDTQEMENVRGNNAMFRALVSAKNGLLAQLVEYGNSLEPGEEVILTPGEGLQLQLRRIKGESAPIADDANPFSKKFVFAG